MKKFRFMTVAMFLAAITLTTTSCSKDENTEGPKVETPADELPVLFGNTSGKAEVEITSNITIKKGTYLLKGWCYITDGVTVTIEPGTVIRGDKGTKAALVVERGGKLIAEGTKNAPIIFTSAQGAGSRRPGDWGGLIICGKAKNNQEEMQIEGGPRSKHGGNDNNDSSGSLKYVRVEFAGYPFKANQEINGITFGSVGKGTQLSHIQVSYCNDDSFEWFGGSVDAKYLVAYHGWDDEFDTDNGYSGNIQYALSVRDPRIADTSLSNGFESDNNSSGDNKVPRTSATFSNVTFVGPIGQDAGFENTSNYINGGNMYPNNGSALGLYQSAMQIRRNSAISCFNSVATGYPVGLILDNEKGNTVGAAKEGTLKLENIVYAGMTITGCDANKQWKDYLVTEFNGSTPIFDETKESYSSTFFKSQKGNQIFTNISDLKLKQPNSTISNANYGPQSGSPLVGKSDLFTDSKVSGSFFDQVDYIGAFASDSDKDNWTAGWCEFDPQNALY